MTKFYTMNILIILCLMNKTNLTIMLKVTNAFCIYLELVTMLQCNNDILTKMIKN